MCTKNSRMSLGKPSSELRESVLLSQPLSPPQPGQCPPQPHRSLFISPSVLLSLHCYYFTVCSSPGSELIGGGEGSKIPVLLLCVQHACVCVCVHVWAPEHGSQYITGAEQSHQIFIVHSLRAWHWGQNSERDKHSCPRGGFILLADIEPASKP